MTLMTKNLSPSGKENRRTLCIIGAPLSHGQSLSGVDKAPDVLRLNGLSSLAEKLNWEVIDKGDLSFRHNNVVYQKPASKLLDGATVRPVFSHEYSSEEILKSELIGEACGQIAEAVRDAAEAGQFVLTIGGDHSIAAGSIAGLLRAHPDLVVVWVDAHGDINIPESSPSHLYHGMPVAHLLGWFKKAIRGFAWMNSVPILKEESVAFVGLRDIDAEEAIMIKNSRVKAFTMKDLDAIGVSEALKCALSSIDPKGTRPIHLSFDIDACDPMIAPGTGTRARGGLTYREAHFICESLYDTGRLVSMDLVEVNPELDKPDEYVHGDDPIIPPDATKTVRLGLELISSVLGKRTL